MDRAIVKVDGITYSEMDFCLAYYKKTLSSDEVTFCLGDYIIDMPAEVAYGAIVDAAGSRVENMPKCLGYREA
jgi:hypothetical protein